MNILALNQKTKSLLPLIAALLCLTTLTALSQKPELVVQAGHSEDINDLSFSPEGKLVATGSEDGTVKIWDAETGQQLRTLSVPSAGILSVVFSSDGTMLASGDDSGAVSVWNVETGKLLQTLKEKCSRVEAISFYPNQPFLASACSDKAYDHFVQLWDLISWNKLGEFSGKGPLVFSPDARYLASRTGDSLKPEQSVQVLDLKAAKFQQFPASFSEFGDTMAFSNDSKLLAQAGGGRFIVWDVENARKRKSFANNSELRMISFTANSQQVLTVGKNGILQIINIVGDQPPVSISGLGEVKYSAISSKGDRLAIIDHDGNNGDSKGAIVKLWKGIDDKKFEPAGQLKGFSFTNSRAAISAGGGMIALSGGDIVRSENRLKVWDIDRETGIRIIANPGDDLVHAIAFDPKGQSLAYGTETGEINMLDPVSGLKQQPFTHCCEISAVAFSADGTLMASSNQEKVEPDVIRIWDVKRHKQLRVIRGVKAGASRLSFSRDGKTLVAGCGDGNVRFWNLATGTLIRLLNASDLKYGLEELTISSNGTLLASSNGQSVKIWNFATGTPIASFKKGLSVLSPIVFSPDGSKIGFEDTDGQIAFYDIKSRSKAVSFAGQTNLTMLGFTLKGKYLVSSDYSSRVKIWDFSSGKEVATLATVGETDWLVTTPDGLFDGTPNAWKQLFWRFDGNTFSHAPVEAFFNEFFRPGLLKDIMDGKTPKPPAKDLTKVDIRQPKVAITGIDDKITASQNDISTANRHIKIKVEVTDNQEKARQADVKTSSGAQDVRLFRNGSLVKVWHSDVLKGKESVTLEATVPVVAGENNLTAYAFNRDNVKSSDATLTIKGADSLKRKGVAYILSVGVNSYANAEYNLTYAVPDAKDFSDELKRQQEKLGNFDHVEVIPLNDSSATKANILKALADISAKIKPEDSLTIYFAGHGTAEGNRFYLIPHDLGYTGSREKLDDAGLKTILTHSISDEELEAAVEGIDAGQLLLVIDACNSGQALEAEEKRRGPMNSKGLAQLAYEKGMYILTAAQSYQAAKEAAKLGHGFLTFALVEEGLKTPAADKEPKDGQVILREWLDFATQRVPQMQENYQKTREMRQQKSTTPANADNVQRPRVFYRREAEPHPMVIARP